MGKYSIGLDLGINNVGWAVYDFEKQEIIDKGVVRYKASDTAENRRNTRSSRRLNKRKHHRVEKLAEYFNKVGLNTKRSYEPEMLTKRIKGLKEELTEEELTNIIYYFAIHRGYIPFDDEKPERNVHKFGENEYPCEYIKEFYDNYGKYRGMCELILYKDNIRELTSILKTQAQYNKKLTNEVIDKIIEIISSKREFWEGPGAAKENQLSPYGRFRNKEDLEAYEKDSNYHKYLYELLIGKCELSIDRLGNMESVAPKYNFFAEEFNFYNDFINMSIISVDSLEPEYQWKVNNRTGHFTEETIEELKDLILKSKTVNFEKIIKAVLNTDLNNIQGYRQDKNKKPEISKFEFYKSLVKKFDELNVKPNWLYEEDKVIYNKVIYILTVSPSSLAIKDMLADRIKDIKFSDAEIEILMDIKQKKNADLKYHSLSESILKRALSDMKKSGLQYNYMQIMKRQEYEKEMKEYFQNNYSSSDKEPYTISDRYVEDLIANPQVKKTIRKAIKVINKIIETQNDYPYVIQIESAKEMNGLDKKKQIEKNQKTYELLNTEAKKILTTNGVTLTSKHIDAVINWLETNHKCAYCGRPLSVNEIISTDYEHILPKSKTMDSTKDNTTCSCSKCNADKKDRTPWEWLTSINQYQQFKERVINEFNMSGKKKNNLLFEGNIEKYSLKFINRNLRDVSYGTTALIEELNKYNEFLSTRTGCKVNIVSIPGQLTHRIRTNLEMEKNRDYLYHHAVDAMILASLSDTKIGKVLVECQNNPKYWIENSNKDYNEKVFDMIWSVHLKNAPQIKDFNTACDNQPESEKDALIKRSFEILKNPVRQFSDANYIKYLQKDGQYYKISQINNIYDLILRDKNGKATKDKDKIDKLFNPLEKSVVLLCEDKDPKLFEKLKAIYEKYNNEINPFITECIYKYGLEDGNKKFDYLLHGIRKTDKVKSPIVVKLRYLEKVNLPYIKELKPKKQNKYNEFIETKVKDNTLIGLTGLGQVCTRIFYSYDDQKFIFMPLYSICFKNKKVDPNNNYYKQLYDYYIGNKKVKRMFDVYCGNIIGAYKKDDSYVEGRYSTFNKPNNKLLCDGEGKKTQDIGITTTVIRILLYETDILGNKYVKFDTKDII